MAMKDHWRNYIDGTWVEGGAGWIDVEDPATGTHLAKQALADAADVDRAVRAARPVHLSGALRDMRPIERGRMVQAMGRYLLEHKDEIARILTLEQGKPLWESEIEVAGAALYFEYYGNQASTVEGRSIPLGRGYFDWTEYEPFGVSAQIIPWNYPIKMTARSLSAGLATGNACVIKSPELTPLTNAWFASAAEAVGFPSGTVNVLCGLGRDAGAALTGHRHVNQIVFTGSVPTGIAIARCGRKCCATRAARQLRAGQVFVNEWYAGGVETPFGGFGKSGYGREKGREALWNYVQTKNVAIRLK